MTTGEGSPLAEEVPSRHSFQIVFLRHGQTEWNAAGLTMGQVDIPLNRTGIAQVLALRAGLARLPITSVWQSPLLRCRQTTRLAFGRPASVPVRTLPGLAERNWGPWQGQSTAGRPGFYSGPSGAEPYEAFEARVAAAVAVVVESSEAETFQAVVAHSGVFRALLRKSGDDTDVAGIANAWPVLLPASLDRPRH